jgi:hypothetical protein
MSVEIIKLPANKDESGFIERSLTLTTTLADEADADYLAFSCHTPSTRILRRMNEFYDIHFTERA